MFNKNYNERARLREILSILKKHNILAGLTPEKVRLILEELGPTYIKMGQIMSMQTDTIPQEYLQELGKLRTDVPPMSDEDLHFIIEETYGKNINELFDDFNYFVDVFYGNDQTFEDVSSFFCVLKVKFCP